MHAVRIRAETVAGPPRPVRRAALSVLALVAVGLGFGATESSHAASISYGVVPQTQLGDGDLRTMRRAGADTARLWLAWSAVDSVQPAGDYDFSAFDAAVIRAARHRVRVLPFLWGTPEWVIRRLEGGACGAGCVANAPSTRRALGAWRDFAAAAARRYGRGGELWREHPGLPRRPIRVWQIWNEQNSSQFFRPKPRAGAYAKLLRAASRGIRGEDRRARIVLGGMAELGGSRKAVPGPKYLARLYRVPGIERSFDGVGVHPYAARASAAVAQVRRFRAAIVRASDRRASIWVTETGWSSGSGSNPLEVGRRGQARMLRQSFAAYRRERGRLRIAGLMWFSWRDAPGGCEWCSRSGLLGRGGGAKPALRAFRSAAR